MNHWNQETSRNIYAFPLFLMSACTSKLCRIATCLWFTRGVCPWKEIRILKGSIRNIVDLYIMSFVVWCNTSSIPASVRPSFAGTDQNVCSLVVLARLLSILLHYLNASQSYIHHPLTFSMPMSFLYVEVSKRREHCHILDTAAWIAGINLADWRLWASEFTSTSFR